jgi:hypothetical protein
VSMDIEWNAIVRLLPALLVVLYMLTKKRRQEKQSPRPVRRAKSDHTEFKRDYEPIEPS